MSPRHSTPEAREAYNTRERELRLQYIAAGLCPMCRGKEPSLPGMALGAKCQARRRVWRQNASGRRTAENNKRALREARREYLALGLCPDCYGRAKVMPGKTSCAECRDRRNVQWNARRDRRVADGKCGTCGAPMDREGVMCTRCLKRHARVCARAYRRDRAQGKCPVCGGKAQPGKSLCGPCATENRARLNAAYREKAARRATCEHPGWRWRVSLDDPRDDRAMWWQWCVVCGKSERRTIRVDAGRLAEVAGWMCGGER